ncbi:MAG: succinate dehydrogenase, cytochrome b556 subunit [Betaproteobacteria bacterium RIFCSPLOWO2_12_FULL_62_13b]|nr:MAG: succinate dehydrogenase, cytochrome b556 subunit [Betaproteobacteria bacterium RIFCSPLOWO2_12_FULL_62_13b]
MPMTTNERPLSPHLQIYKVELPMLLSGLHRITGIALSVGSILLVAWISSAVHSAEAFASMNGFLGGYIGQFVLFGWTFSLIYHSVSGVRHLIWDTGRLLEVGQIHSSSKIVLAITIVLTLLAWILGGGFPGGGV